MHIARAYLPDLPSLSIFQSETNATVSWPSTNTGGFVLEQAESLIAPLNWVPDFAQVVDDGTNKSVSLPATNSSRIFRLRRP